MAITKKIASQDYVTEAAKETIYTPQELTDEQKVAAQKNVGIPTMTPEDAGKFLRVGSDGKLVLETIPSAEGGSF